jgi:hypothetical protein
MFVGVRFDRNLAVLFNRNLTGTLEVEAEEHIYFL